MKPSLKITSILIILIITFQFALLINLRFTAWPEMTLWPYLIIKGWLPYKDIAIAHTPLMLATLTSFYKIFGLGIIQLKIFTWVLIVAFDFLIYVTASGIWNRKTAIVSVAVFAFWQLFFDGNGLWFDLFMGIFALLTFYFLQKKKYFWSGVVLALAIISKQTAIWFLIPVVFELIVKEKKNIRGYVNLVCGGLIIFIIFAFSLLGFKMLPDFYGWAIKFGIFILPKSQGQIQLPDVKNLLVAVFPFLIVFPLLLKTGKKNINLALWALAGTLGAYPRFEYFHFQPAIPFLSMATSLVVLNIRKLNKFTKLFIAFYLIGSLYLFMGFFIRNYREGVRFYETDVKDIVSYINSNTVSVDKVFVMNWWDSVYALADRLPAIDPWIPQLSWYSEIPGIQEKMVIGLKTSKPVMVILNPYSDTGLSAYIPQKVYNYVMMNYELKEKIDGIEIMIPKR